MKLTAVWLPIAVGALGIIHWIAHGMARNFLAGAAALLVFSLVVSRFLYRRSQGLEASLFYVRVLEGDYDPLDSVALVGAAGLFLMAMFLPLLR